MNNMYLYKVNALIYNYSFYEFMGALEILLDIFRC